MVRAKDPFWVHVDQPKGKKIGCGFVCNFCGEEFCGGATRIKFHLSKETGGDIKSCTKVPQHVSLEATESIRDLKKTRELKSDRQVKGMSNNPRHANQDDPSLVNAKLAKFLLLNNIPFELVETPLFKEFVKSVAKFGTGYKLPSISMLRSHDWIYDTELVERVEEYTRDVEESLVETGCTLIANTVDMENCTAMVIYLWTPKGLLFKAKFQVQGTYQFIFGYFTNKLSSTVKSLEPRYTLCDEELYYAVRMRGVFSHYKVEYIANHALYIILEILDEIRHSSLDVLTCASMIFLYMNNSSSINLTLGKEHERGKESHVSSSKFVIREYASMSSKKLASLVIRFSRLKSLLAAQDALQASQVCISQVSEQSRLSSEAKYARFVYLAINCEEFWRRAKQLVQVLQPLFEALCLVACQGGTIGYLYQVMERAKSKVEEYSMVENIYGALHKEWYIGITRTTHEAAAMLDPAFMLEQNLEDRKIDDIWCSVFDGLVEDSDKERFRDEFDAYCSKNSNIFTSSALDKSRTLHPGEWWRSYGNSVPVLQKYALRIVIQPCTSNFFTDDELRLIIEDETEGQFRTKKLMMDRSSELKAHLQGSINLDGQITKLYEFARQVETNLTGYDSTLDKIDDIDKDFWNASQDPSFRLLDEWPQCLYSDDDDENEDDEHEDNEIEDDEI